MRLLDRLILSELLGPFIFGVALFSSLLMAAIYLFGLTDYFVQGAPVFMVVQLMLLYIPGLMSWTFPMASLLAVLLAFNRLSSDSELIAIFASGISFRRILLPVLAAGLAFGGVQLLFNEQIVPRTSFLAAQVKTTILKKLGRGPDTIMLKTMKDGKLYETVIAAKSELKSNSLFQVTFTRYDVKTGRPIWIATADKATYKEGDWTFENAQSWGGPSGSTLVRGQTGEWLKIPIPDLPKSPNQIINDMIPAENLGSSQIRKRIHDKTILGEDTLGLEVEYYNKFAVPLASAIFCLLGAPLAIRDPRRSGSALGYFSALMIIITYWLLMRIAGVLGSGGALAPWFAAFFPNILGFIAAIALLLKRSK